MRIKLDYPLSINEICLATGAIAGNEVKKSDLVHHICTDTRECQKGDLFIALCGEKDSGEKYVIDAINKKCFVISSTCSPYVIQVNNTADALLDIARHHKSKTKIKYTVAVTGSVGKSTTVRFISKILNQHYVAHSPIGNYNNHIGLPLTVLSAKRNTEVLIVELGMNHKNEISRLSKCVSPDIGIITAIGTSHIGNLGSRKKIAEAKLEIRDGMNQGLLLLPYGEPLLSNQEDGMYVALNSALSDFSLNTTESDGMLFSSPYGKMKIKRPHDLPSHLLTNLAFAISSAELLNLSKDEINKGVDAITSYDLSQRFIRLGDFTIFDDSYNASLESVTADLEYISTFSCPKGAFLGDVLELGEEADMIHKSIGHTAARLMIDRLYLYGKYASLTAQGAIEAGMDSNQIFVNSDLSSPEISISHIKNNHLRNEIILFKASHKLKLDKIADRITKEEGITNDG